MTLFCTVCKSDIPPERVKRAVTCSPVCAKELNRLKVADRAKKKCRLCGRRFKSATKLEPVLTQHTPLVATKAVELTREFIRSRFERLS
jgi:hypothetical protein